MYEFFFLTHLHISAIYTLSATYVLFPDVPNICSVPVDTTKSSTQPEPEAAARAPDMTVPGVAAKQPHREDGAVDDVPPPAYCDVYPSPPLYCEVPPLPTYEEARDTGSRSVSRL